MDNVSQIANVVMGELIVQTVVMKMIVFVSVSLSTLHSGNVCDMFIKYCYEYISLYLLLLFYQWTSLYLVECRVNEWTCDNDECIAVDRRCDGRDDCRDGSDEDGCKYYLYILEIL